MSVPTLKESESIHSCCCNAFKRVLLFSAAAAVEATWSKNLSGYQTQVGYMIWSNLVDFQRLTLSIKQWDDLIKRNINPIKPTLVN